jgi:hypothetical protein
MEKWTEPTVQGNTMEGKFKGHLLKKGIWSGYMKKRMDGFFKTLWSQNKCWNRIG